MHKRFIYSLLLIFSVIGLFFGLKIGAGADSIPNWVSSTLSVQKEADTQSLPISLNGNVDCAMEDSTNCSVPTAYGSATQNGTVRLSNTVGFKPVISYIDNRQHFLPIPNSSTAITYTTEPPYGFYLYFNYNFSSSITKTTVPGSTASQYQINRAQDGKLADKTNHRLAADYVSMSFSANGQWMVVSEPNVAMLRVNLQTFEVLPFAPGFNYTIGIDPAVKTAITNDGHYAVVASKDFTRFSLYDLSTCASVPDTINGPVSCQSRDLQSFMQQQVPGYASVNNARFLDDDTLAVYSSYKVGSVFKTARYVISSTNIASQIDYLALGDSYISGEGAFDYQGGTDTPGNTCHLSLVSYPYLIGHDLNYNSYHSVACSGAHIDDITNISIPNTKKSSQAKDRKDASYDSEIYSSFLPGYRAQLNFVQKYRPKALTISIGGNDIGFSTIVRRCAEPWALGTCYANYEDRLELVREINNKFPALVGTYQKLKNAAAPDSKIYIIGYPQIAKPGGDCSANAHLNAQELTFAQQMIGYFDSVIQQAAAKAGVYYVDTQDALNGHRLCEAGPGSVAMNGLTVGNDFPSFLHGPLGNESYHPNDFGHQLLENKVLSATHNLTDPMPTSSLNAGPSSETGLDILNAPHSGRPVNVASYDDSLTNDTLIDGSTSPLTVDGLNFSLKPNASYNAQLRSDPVNLGDYTTDANGNLSAQVQIPASILPGYHTLHVYGTNLAGDPVDIYKTIYVGASQDDLDGDGIPNAIDTCLVIAPIHQDYDQDGIDDACDGSIGLPPPPPPAPEPEPEPEPAASAPVNSSDNDVQTASTPDPIQPNDLSTVPIPAASQAVAFNSSDVSAQPEQVLGATTPKIQPTNEPPTIPSIAVAHADHKASKPAVLAAGLAILNILIGFGWKFRSLIL